jgi:transcriptional regulator with XRE-family HTH domain
MTSQTQEAWVPQWTFGDRLRKVRREKGLSQAELALALDVKGPQIASWETGANNPRDIVTVAKRLQLALGVPAEWTLGLDAGSSGPDRPGGTLGDGNTRRYSNVSTLVRSDYPNNPFGQMRAVS